MRSGGSSAVRVNSGPGEMASWVSVRIQRSGALIRTVPRGELVLFLGSGVSKGAGLPLWGPLLDELAGRSGFRRS